MNEASKAALQPIRTLRERVEAICTQYGFSPEDISFKDMGEDGSPHLHLMVEYGGKPESPIAERAHEAMIDQAQQSNQEQVRRDLEKARENLSREMKKDGGFL